MIMAQICSLRLVYSSPLRLTRERCVVLTRFAVQIQIVRRGATSPKCAGFMRGFEAGWGALLLTLSGARWSRGSGWYLEDSRYRCLWVAPDIGEAACCLSCSLSNTARASIPDGIIAHRPGSGFPTKVEPCGRDVSNCYRLC